MLLTKANLDIAAFASKGVERLAINGVRLTHDFTEAADGLVLVRVQTPNADATQYPEIEGVLAYSGDCVPEKIIPRDAAEKIGKAIPKKSTLPILCHAVWDTTRENGTVRLAATDLETATVFDAKAIDAQWPNSENAFPKDEPKFSFLVDARRLEALCHFFAKHAESMQIRMDFFAKPEDKKPVRITAETETGQTITALLMPMVR